MGDTHLITLLLLVWWNYCHASVVQEVKAQQKEIKYKNDISDVANSQLIPRIQNELRDFLEGSGQRELPDLQKNEHDFLLQDIPPWYPMPGPDPFPEPATMIPPDPPDTEIDDPYTEPGPEPFPPPEYPYGPNGVAFGEPFPNRPKIDAQRKPWPKRPPPPPRPPRPTKFPKGKADMMEPVNYVTPNNPNGPRPRLRPRIRPRPEPPPDPPTTPTARYQINSDPTRLPPGVPPLNGYGFGNPPADSPVNQWNIPTSISVSEEEIGITPHTQEPEKPEVGTVGTSVEKGRGDRVISKEVEDPIEIPEKEFTVKPITEKGTTVHTMFEKGVPTPPPRMYPFFIPII